MCDEKIPDDEVLLRRIPPGERYFEPPNRISSFNFKLRKGEKGLSIYRERYITADELLKKQDAIPGSFVVKATAKELRRHYKCKG